MHISIIAFCCTRQAEPLIVSTLTNGPTDSHYQIYLPPSQYSLEANHLIWVWIMKVKGPKNQADFIEVLYVVVNAWGATFFKYMGMSCSMLKSP